MRIILFFFSKLFVEIVLEFCNSRNETIGSCFIIFSPRENMKIFILISTEEFSIRESIINRSGACFFFLFSSRDSRQVHVLGRKDKFPEVLHVQRVMTGSFLSLESARDRLARRVFLLLPVTGIRGGEAFYVARIHHSRHSFGAKMKRRALTKDYPLAHFRFFETFHKNR